ncbi:putative Fat-inducing protein 1 [uncultured delta proteobacterium]|uniref:Putative Fat-inducing protein 1 n=1 Tax=uncultured delta proteobacterium TaxID=34034 RepID=A0A212KGN5_9DELT|nr:putative Fat-inducing protein 1 [uncultured delta proteobacterium]
MDAEKLSRLERLLERKLSSEEKERLHRVQDAFGISDNDALWELITAMEYQRKYYDELPGKISQAATEIFSGLSQAAQNEVALAQGKLAESVVKQAERLSLKSHIRTLLMWGALALVFLLLHGSLLMWLGFQIGSGQTQPPVMLLRMPVGFVLAGIGLFGGILFGTCAARSFSEGNPGWKKNLGIASGIVLVSMLVLSTAI